MKNKMIVMAMFTAIEVILKSYLAITTPVMRISFAFFPLVVIAILYGAVSSAVVAGIADLIGLLLYPVGPFHPGLTISAILTGIIFGVFLYKKPKSIWRVLGATLTVNFGINAFLNSVWIYQMTGKAILILLPGRIIQNIIMTPIVFLMTWFVAYKITSLRKLATEE